MAPPSEELNEGAGDNFLKCCENTKLKIVVCITCGAAYHRSCFGRGGITPAIIPGDARVQRCADCINNKEGKALTPNPRCGTVNPLEYELLRKENECFKREIELLKKSVTNLEDIVNLQKIVLQGNQSTSTLKVNALSFSQVIKTNAIINNESPATADIVVKHS